MKLWETFRLEFGYQARRLSTALYAVVLAAVACLFVRGNYLADAMYAEFYVNSPFIIASVTVLCSLFWLVFAAGVTGETAARDVETGMHPLTYTAPVRKAELLGGRFLAAFALNALLLLGVMVGVLVAVYAPGLEPEMVGPFRPAAYLTAYGYLALPTAFIGTAFQFAWATLGRRAIASYVGSVLLLVVAYGGLFAVLFFLDPGSAVHDRGIVLLDAFGHLYMTSDAVLGWTAAEKSTRLLSLSGSLLGSRLLWVGFGLAALAFTYARFRFAHYTPRPFLRVLTRWRRHAPTPAAGSAVRTPVAVPKVRRTFGPALYARQTLVVAWTSFRAIARGWSGLVPLGLIALLTVRLLPERLATMGTPLLPTTAYVLSFLTTTLTDALTPWVVIPLLIVLWAGELVWREREAGLGEIADAAPVPDGVRFGGRFLGLALMLAVWMGLLLLAGVLVQLTQGYPDVQLGLYLRVLFGLQLPEYLLFAALVLAVHGMIDQKYVGHFVALLLFALVAFSPRLGLRHHLLAYGTSPGWLYSDMRGFGLTLGPWLWFKAYWAAWAVLLAVAAQLLWVRGREGGLRARLRLARGRLTRPAAVAAVAGVAGVVGLGLFIFYNTNVLNRYTTAADGQERAAEYERRYARYADAPQPRLAAARLRVELYPERGAAEVLGAYRLVNEGTAPIDTLHLTTIPDVETGGVTFSRPARAVVEDDAHGHRIYRLATPLQPGSAVLLRFRVAVRARGFRNGGVDPHVVPNGTWLTNADVLPAIGYQHSRELFPPGQRRAHGLPARPVIPTLADAEDVTGEAGGGGGADRLRVETFIGTAGNQIAVAPGALRRMWRRDGRRYAHYVTDAPIGNEFGFFSAAYSVREDRWAPDGDSARAVPIQIYYHPAHRANVDRLLHSVRASLDHNSRAYGPYPYPYIRLIENPVRTMGAHADAATIDYGQGFALYAPAAQDPRGLDFPFAVMAHEMAHQWGVPYAFAEGAPLLSESFAWYAALGVVEATYGREHQRRLLRFFRQPYPIMPIRQSLPLLRAMDPYASYRKGPFALYALSEYAGKSRVDLAWRRFYDRYRPGTPPLPTSLDLYRELQATTPAAEQTLLHDLFEANTFWELATEQATAERTADGAWRVTLRVRARKVTVDPDGVETEVPMDERVQVGVFAPAEPGEDFGETLYLRWHRVRSGTQTVTVTVPREPSDAGVDPYVLLIDLERFDNVERVEVRR